LWLIIIRVAVDYAAIIRRHISGNLLLALAGTPAVLVNGARQTGKSSLVVGKITRWPARDLF
jgi:predicted AAA+ superfamily ATPase